MKTIALGPGTLTAPDGRTWNVSGGLAIEHPFDEYRVSASASPEEMDAAALWATGSGGEASFVAGVLVLCVEPRTEVPPALAPHLVRVQ